MLLKVRGLEVHYGAAQALFGVDLSINEGEMVAMLGRNGMGKSTTISSICQMMTPTKGTIEFCGQTLNRMSSHKAARLGLGLVPEGRRCFPNLSVLENLSAAARKGQWTLERVYALFPRLKERKNQSANTLSGGEQQMLAISRALMTNPKLLILDEATEGLAPVVRGEIWQAIATLKKEGLSILIVDKTLKELLPLADQAIILEKGESVWAGQPSALTEEMKDRYLGL
ncbi:High-affinity branched-chain amino acid transport ATP-binding protein LivF [Pseudovibrio axinellae]|uniref:High-affinity branched-chain amino acid transport ATP-binding protein LivF n=1 Tax=Pseudovibrio axinellae TaxID=989403 RepID=A0A165XI76_9HYPH|nr:ABC transporter ATP-binding protein [Pseudovibrio axinellae]KZL17725.1 High-affinity branched-chain amino acid transport ATP-binding protein LivF [Pseudovibrio axinellae]SER42178.1 amino acid/amide ABC transporter ATP-binding protein 2, HAAT family [Pseudovibrio axinellae]